MAIVAQSLDLKERTLAANAEYYMSVVGLTGAAVVGGATKKYIISATVSDIAGAGTGTPVQIVLNGTKGSSKPVTISQFVFSSLSQGQTTTQAFDLPDIGDLLTVDIQLVSFLLTDALHLRYLVVVDVSQRRVDICPCYRWITSKLTVRSGAGTLAFRDAHPTLLAQRQAELTDRRHTYNWGTNTRYQGFPGYIGADRLIDLPADVQFADVDAGSFVVSGASAAAAFGLKFLLSLTDRVPDFKGYFDLAKGMGNQGNDAVVMQKVYEDWNKDAEFGRQFLNGQNPVILEQCTSIPTNFPAQTELTNQGYPINLAAEQAAGKLYIANYSILDNLLATGEKSTANFCAPICLFHVLPTGELVPIAIQLKQQPSPSNPVWTPMDGNGWLLAKIFVRNADANVHQAVTHLFKTHLVLEAFATATWRQLPEVHPVFKLLIPHIRTTLAINAAARDALINDGGFLDVTLSIGVKGAYEAVRRGFSKFSVQDLVFPDAMTARGVADVSLLPNYNFRDDGIKVWNIIRSYVDEVLALYYLSDADVQHDSELQAWILDLYTNGFPASGTGSHHGLNNNLAKVNELAVLITSVIFQASAGHAGVNFCQLAYYGFAPNAPLALRADPPTSKNNITMDVVMNTLPWKKDVANQLITAYVLSRFSVAEIFLGQFPELHFSEQGPNDAMRRFKSKLDQLNADLTNRNSTLGLLAYPYLLPSLTPNSIAK